MCSPGDDWSGTIDVVPDSIQLVRPTPTVHASYLSATVELRQAHGAGSHWPGYDVLPGQTFRDAEVASCDGFARFAAAVASVADPATPLPAGFVHDTRLWLVDFGTPAPTYLGRISIRHELTDFLRTVGGHIGYVIRPSARGRGLGTRMLAEALPVAAGLGIDPALITCDDDNIASAKVILANGGAEDLPFERKRRFWVPTRTPQTPPMAEVFGRQWSALRAWLERLSPDDLRRPSVLDGWTVGDLVAHLVRTCQTVSALRPAPPEATPQTVHRYVSAYADAAADIAAGTRALAGRIEDPLAALDQAWAQVPAALAGLQATERPGRVVVSARGPIRLGDFLLTRTLELVVHADDLARSLDREPPLLPAATSAVTRALIDVGIARSGRALRPDGLDDLTWIRLACGRVGWRQAGLTGPPADDLPLL
jgi:uncharacterized protein (TIGR03083 family)